MNTKLISDYMYQVCTNALQVFKTLENFNMQKAKYIPGWHLARISYPSVQTADI